MISTIPGRTAAVSKPTLLRSIPRSRPRCSSTLRISSQRRRNEQISASHHVKFHPYCIAPNHQQIQLQYNLPVRYLSTEEIPSPTIDLPALHNTLLALAPSISQSLSTQGYYTTTSLLPSDSISLLRTQAIHLRKSGRYEPSWSERLEGHTIKRFDKKGVYACEPDGGDYFSAPDLISYIAALLQTLPGALNEQLLTREVALSNSAFNAKLAVTTAGGSKYPLHIDNPVGNGMDVRKLTAILYLNPGWVEGMGGEIRLFVNDEKEEGVKNVDLSPVGGRLLLFWSDEIPHEVLATSSSTGHDEQYDDGINKVDEETDDSTTYSDSDRYALTVWIPTDNGLVLHDERSKFAALKDLVHFG